MWSDRKYTNREVIVTKSRDFLPIKSDVIFRLFFADERNSEFLKGFLKSVLKLPDEDYNEIEIADTNLLREYVGDKLGIIDIKLRTKSKKVIHIEVQLLVSPTIRERIVFYDAKLITEQIGSGDDYGVIRRVIIIVITDEDLLQDNSIYHHRFTFYDKEAGVEFTDLIEIHTLELSKLPRNTDGTLLYDWASFIAAETKEELDMVAERNPQVGKAVVKLWELSADEKARAIYEDREKARRDENMRLNGALKKQALASAKVLLKCGVPIETIIESNGLTREEIESLQQAI